MDSDFNVDIICNETGEVLEEGMLFAAAHIYIAKREGKIVKDEVVFWGPRVTGVRDLYVEFPEVVEDLKDYHERMKRASKFWNYSARSFVDACGIDDEINS